MTHLRLISSDEGSPESASSDDEAPGASSSSAPDETPLPPERTSFGPIALDYAEQRRYKELSRLFFRVLQLDEILHRRCAFNAEKAADIKARIEKAQQRLDRLYAEMGATDQARVQRMWPR